MKTISVNEWLGELAKIESAKRGEPAGMTTREIEKALGVGSDKAHDLIRRAIEEGRCKVGKRFVPAISGDMRQVPAYEFLGPAKEKGRK